MTEPLVAALLTRYADLLKDNFDPEAAEVYSQILYLLKNTSAEIVTKIPVPTKGEK